MDSKELWKVLEEADLLASQGEVDRAIDRMAAEITGRLRDSRPLVLCVMNGGLIISGQLLPKLHFPLEIDYTQATRYGNETTGGGLTWKAMPQRDMAGRTVLIMDDILDEGVTLDSLARYCYGQGAQEVLLAVLVEKLHLRKVKPGMRADFSGLEVGDRFLFGYGLDYKGYWRNAPGIYAVKGL
ncbi:MAG: hypoxanthine-guanine phosphoribosyltransferase [Geobacter sp.]|nr:MAG: hypoxanthine-guanine phosphoribosyltransferase [Geobacter sp.]